MIWSLYYAPMTIVLSKMHPEKRDIMETSCKLGGNFKSTERFVVFDKYSNAKCRRSCIQNSNCEGILFRKYHSTFIPISNTITYQHRLIKSPTLLEPFGASDFRTVGHRKHIKVTNITLILLNAFI